VNIIAYLRTSAYGDDNPEGMLEILTKSNTEYDYATELMDVRSYSQYLI